MEKAYNTFDVRDWDAIKFDEIAGRDSEWLKHRRKFFVCCGCERSAVFVSKSRDSRLAHFRSRHADGCDYAGLGRGKPESADELTEVPAEYNEGSTEREMRYEILSFPGPASARLTEQRLSGSDGRPGVTHVLPESRPRTHQSTTSLAGQLAHLRNNASYPSPDDRLKVPDRGSSVRAVDYFCRFEEATEAHALPLPQDPDGRSPLMAYWGVIARPVRSSNRLWLNAGEVGQGLMSIRLEYDPFMTALGIDDHLILRGYHLIVEGRLLQGPHALYVSVTDLTKVAIRAPRLSAF